MAVYIAKVLIAFEADSAAEACDAVSAMLSENLQQGGGLLDWSYHADYDGGAYSFTHPRHTPIIAAEWTEDGPGSDMNTIFDEAEQEPLG